MNLISICLVKYDLPGGRGQGLGESPCPAVTERPSLFFLAVVVPVVTHGNTWPREHQVGFSLVFISRGEINGVACYWANGAGPCPGTKILVGVEFCDLK